MTATLVDEPALSAGSGRTNREWALKVISAVMPAATVALMIFFSLSTKSFLSLENLLVVAMQNAPLMILAVAVAALLMAGYVDLSVGSVIAVTGVTAGLAFQNLGVVAGVLLGLLAGLIMGAVNGLLIGLLKLSPIVVTLGMLAAGRGIAQLLAPGSVFGFPDGVAAFGAGRFLGVSYLVWIAVLVVLVGMFVINQLPIGRHIIAVGVNDRAAYLNGISVRWLIFWLYLVVGSAAAVAGLLTVARLNSAPSGTLGLGFEVTVLTAVLLGGIPFTGGRGALWRVVLGVWLMGILANGITLMNVGPELSGVLTGAVLILAAALEGLRVWLKRRG